jgi:hypothetical protein
VSFNNANLTVLRIFMEGAGRKKVKTDSPQGFLGIELEEHNMNKLYTVVNVIIDYLQHSKYIINHQIHSK